MNKTDNIITTTVFVRQYKEISPELTGYISKAFNGNITEANDIVQDAFLKAWDKRDSYTGKGSIKSWIYSIGVNLLKEKFRRKNLISYSSEIIETSSNSEQTISEIIKDEITDKIYCEINKLPDNQKEVFRLVRLEGKSYLQAAKKLNVSTDTIRMRLYRASNTLTKQLKEYQNIQE